MKIKILELLAIIGIAGLVTASYFFYRLFYKAFNDERYQVILQINEFGEAQLESIGLLILIPFIIFSLYYILKKSFIENL